MTPEHANELFYRAFRTQDASLMRAVWAQSPDVTCIHPGWGPVRGYLPVLRSWAAILGQPTAPDITYRLLTCHQAGEMAYLVCEEQVEGHRLIATNVFRREADRWKLMLHQAGPSSEGLAEEFNEDDHIVYH